MVPHEEEKEDEEEEEEEKKNVHTFRLAVAEILCVGDKLLKQTFPGTIRLVKV